MAQPAQKLFTIIKGATFNYRFQYLGANESTEPVNLTGYTANLVVTWPTGQTIYNRQNAIFNLGPGALQVTGQVGLLNSNLTSMQLGTVSLGTVSAPTSGVYFGGDSGDPANGIVDLVISANDTSNITWSLAQYRLVLNDPTGVVIVILAGGMGVVGSLPTFANA